MTYKKFFVGVLFMFDCLAIIASQTRRVSRSGEYYHAQEKYGASQGVAFLRVSSAGCEVAKLQKIKKIDLSKITHIKGDVASKFYSGSLGHKGNIIAQDLEGTVTAHLSFTTKHGVLVKIPLHEPGLYFNHMRQMVMAQQISGRGESKKVAQQRYAQSELHGLLD